jgi:hypothetical protein
MAVGMNKEQFGAGLSIIFDLWGSAPLVGMDVTAGKFTSEQSFGTHFDT